MATEKLPNDGMPHHCGTCECCGGRIPCGVTHVREWTYSGECPGHTNTDGTCGGLRHTHARKYPTPGRCHN